MLLADEIIEELLKLTTNLTKEVAISAHKYIGNNNSIRGFDKYPIKDDFFNKTEELAKLYETVPMLIYNIPRYELKDFPVDKIQYGAIFYSFFDGRIDVSKINGFDDLYNYIITTKDLRNAFFGDQDVSEGTLEKIISGIVERYLYSINATDTIPNDLDLRIRPFIAEKLLRYISDKLKIDIYIPICLATFEDEIITLSNNIEITKIPEDVQKSRKHTCTYSSYFEDSVASCATHMIVIHDYYFDNKEWFSINSATTKYTSYPLNVIDNIMAIIRIVTGYSIGYQQILSKPISWIDSSFADLIPLYGAKTHFVNPKEYEKNWLSLPVEYINSQQIKEIKALYEVISTLNENSKNNKLFFAMNRLNRCLLRDKTDDAVIDATIGLEALLSGGTKGEITYTISNRIPVIFTQVDGSIYPINECRTIMKKIYNYRSMIVHGGIIKDKDKKYAINNIDFPIEQVAVDFLRYTLLFIIKNINFLDASEFDKYIDKMILSMQENKIE